jgi:hypothetical protein
MFGLFVCWTLPSALFGAACALIKSLKYCVFLLLCGVT